MKQSYGALFNLQTHLICFGLFPHFFPALSLTLRSVLKKKKPKASAPPKAAVGPALANILVPILKQLFKTS